MKKMSTKPVVKGAQRKASPRMMSGSGKPRGSAGIMTPKPSQRRKPPR